VVGGLRKKRVGWIGIVWSRRVHQFLCLTCENRAAVVSAYLSNIWLQPDVIRASVISRFQRLPISREARSR
jgi:hypothetical protein